MPESWDDRKATDPDKAARARRRRERCAIPDDQRHREKWRLALDMIDELAGWSLPARPVVAGYGDASGFRQGLTDRGLTYVVAVNPIATAQPAAASPVTPDYGGIGRRPELRYPDPPADLKTLVVNAGRFVIWRHGSHKSAANPTGRMRSRFISLQQVNRVAEVGRCADVPMCQ